MPNKHTTKHGKVKAQNNKKQHLYAFFIKKNDVPISQHIVHYIILNY